MTTTLCNALGDSAAGRIALHCTMIVRKLRVGKPVAFHFSGIAREFGLSK